LVGIIAVAEPRTSVAGKETVSDGIETVQA
jgi:hypothetical protein